MSTDPKRFLKYLDAERKASLLYRALAQTVDGERREALIELADIEDEHAKHWIAKCAEQGLKSHLLRLHLTQMMLNSLAGPDHLD